MDASTIQHAPAAAFNLAQYEAADTAIFRPTNPKTGKPLLGTDGKPVEFEMYGPGSEQHLAITTKQGRAAEARLIEVMQGKGDEDEDKPKDDSRKQLIEKLTACTKRISDNFPVAPADVFANPKLGYILNGANAFITGWGNFLPESSVA